ncbi:MAG: hypothetical protein GX803_04875 [Lentisphaerae bacterium]|jgi:predicted O-methyltransferase YrrM|nr:hypothetical protein [Lentisphaerota bacterium]
MTRTFFIPPGLGRVVIPPEAGDLPVPRYVDAFIRDAEDRAEDYDTDMAGGYFVPSDTRYFFQILQWLLEAGYLSRTGSFLEWGSGQGLATMFAAMLGLTAVGVEIDARLVAEAKGLAARYGVSARFVHGSYDPDRPGPEIVTAKGYDVVHVYPWPGEEGRCLQLFEATASPGALMMLCLGAEEIQLFRKPE